MWNIFGLVGRVGKKIEVPRRTSPKAWSNEGRESDDGFPGVHLSGIGASVVAPPDGSFLGGNESWSLRGLLVALGSCSAVDPVSGACIAKVVERRGRGSS